MRRATVWTGGLHSCYHISAIGQHFECGATMAAERREMMCTGKCHKITEHVYLIVIAEYAGSNIGSPNRGKFMKLSYVLRDYNPQNKAIFGKGYQCKVCLNIRSERLG